MDLINYYRHSVLKRENTLPRDTVNRIRFGNMNNNTADNCTGQPKQEGSIKRQESEKAECWLPERTA
jgi:hypothetical protein